MAITNLSGNVWATVAVVVMTAGLVPMLAMAADEDSLQDFCVADMASGVVMNGFPCKPPAEVTVRDFWSPLLKYPANTNTVYGVNVTPAIVDYFPGLNTLGISAVRIDYARGGLNPPHTHPRSSELLLVVKGELYAGFVSTSDVLFATTVKEGELFVIPRGLLHFQLNVGKGPAQAFAALNSQSPGAQRLGESLFTPNIKDQVLQKGFRIDQKTLATIRKPFQT